MEQLLDGRQVDCPHPSGTNVTRKRAPKAKAPVPENLDMFAMAPTPCRCRYVAHLGRGLANYDQHWMTTSFADGGTATALPETV